LSILCEKPELVKNNKNAVVASSSHLLPGRTGKNKDLSQWSVSIINRTGKHEGCSHLESTNTGRTGQKKDSKERVRW